VADLAGLDPEQQLALFAARARAAGLVHQAGDLAQVRRVVAVVRANLAAFSAYRARPYDGLLTLVRAGNGHTVAEPDDLGWGRLAAGVTRLEAPGDHISLLAEPHVATLADQLRAMISRVLAGR